jgi:hypothetical protein
VSLDRDPGNCENVGIYVHPQVQILYEGAPQVSVGLDAKATLQIVTTSLAIAAEPISGLSKVVAVVEIAVPGTMDLLIAPAGPVPSAAYGTLEIVTRMLLTAERRICLQIPMMVVPVEHQVQVVKERDIAIRARVRLLMIKTEPTVTAIHLMVVKHLCSSTMIVVVAATKG